MPALRSITPDIHHLIKPAEAFGNASGGGRWLRELLVVVQVALAILLLVGAGLMVKSFGKLSDVDPGFRQEGVVSVAVQLPGSRYGRAEWLSFFERLAERVHANVRLVVPGYFEAMDMVIGRGRTFDRLDARSERKAVIVNETLAARYFKDRDPIGRPVRMKVLGEVEVVGVVSDIRHGGLQSKYESEIYVPYGRISTSEMHVVIQSELDTSTVSANVGAILAEMEPRLVPSRVDSVSDLLWESVAVPRFNTALLSGLALSAAILALVGTYGIVAYSVSRRTTEIGVRMALGASAGRTIAMVVRRAVGLVLVGSVLGAFGALGATRWMAELLFEVNPSDPATYASVLAASLGVGAVAAWGPARRAARVDPVVALRNE